MFQNGYFLKQFAMGTLHVVVFVALAPLIGGYLLSTLSIAALAIWFGSLGTVFLAPLGYLLLFMVTVPTSYSLAAPVAALTGATFAVASIWIKRERDRYIAAAIIGSSASLAFLAPLKFFTNNRSGLDLIPVCAGLAISGCVASLACAYLSQSLERQLSSKLWTSRG